MHHNMSTKSTSLRPLLLVALASFFLGVVVDRAVLSSGDPTHGSGADGSDRGAKKGITDSRNLTSSTPVSSKGKRDRSSGSPGDSSDDETNLDQGEGGVAAQVRQILEGLERGERINASVADKLLSQVPPGRHRLGVIERLAWHWGRQDPEAAAAWANELSGRDQWVALESLLHGWAETDPAGAAGYVAQLPNSEHNLHLVRRMAHVWAERDRAAAMDWARGQADLATRRQALGGVVELWAGADPAAAAAFASSIDNPYERNELLGIAARRWANQDTPEALDWANGLPGEDRQRATNAILHGIAERDPARAAALFENLSGGQPSRNPQETHAYQRMAREVASIWAHSDPEAAAAWAIDLPEAGGVQRGAVAEATERWLRMDGMAAGEWILQLPEGETRDAASERVVHTTLPADPEAAFEWASSISDTDRQTGLMHHVLERWRLTDPASARTAMNAVDLSPEQRRHLGGLFGEVPDSSPAQNPGHDENPAQPSPKE